MNEFHDHIDWKNVTPKTFKTIKEKKYLTAEQLNTIMMDRIEYEFEYGKRLAPILNRLRSNAKQFQQRRQGGIARNPNAQQRYAPRFAAYLKNRKPKIVN